MQHKAEEDRKPQVGALVYHVSITHTYSRLYRLYREYI